MTGRKGRKGMTLKKDTKTPKTKKPIYKRIWFWILIVFILFAAVGGKGNKSSETASPAADAATESVSSGLSAPADDDVSKESEAETEAADSALDFQVTYYDSFRNDVTGNWRKALVVTGKPIEDYALDYYKEYFKSDDELHVIYNFGLNTANSIQASHGVLYVSVFDYVDKEEHDADLACSGTHLAEYMINIKTGEVEEVPLTAD